MKWKNTHKILPDAGQEVLGFLWKNKSIIITQLIGTTRWIGYRDCCDEQYYGISDISHWMPLPEEPKLHK